MITSLLISLRAMIVFTLLCGAIYPLAITGISQLIFPRQANGSLLITDQTTVGSELLAQKFVSGRYFWPRPSAADYGTVASGASNQGFTSAKLLAAVNERKGIVGENAPSDLLYASGSGLDPHISPASAQYQISRVAMARGLDPAKVASLVSENLEPPQFGFLGQSRVNVLLLNRALDAIR